MNASTCQKIQIKYILFTAIILSAMPFSCTTDRSGYIMTVKGRIPAKETGIWLPHEHILVDFTGADSISRPGYNRDSVIIKVLPYLKEARKLGCRTFADCTPDFLGRDPLLLKELSESSGLSILTNTGLYGAHENKFIPKWAFDKTAEELSKMWIAEWENGIGGTRIKPGFIKIAVMPDSLSTFHKTLVRAAALTHLATGLTIASHTGPALPAFQELEIIEKEGVSPEAFIWIHAHAEKDITKLADAARKGAWISIDKLNENNINELIPVLRYMKNEGMLHKVMVSHDAGWYDPARPDGGEFRGFSTLFTRFIPALKYAGFSDFEIRLITEINPERAFAIRVRKLNNKDER